MTVTASRERKPQGIEIHRCGNLLRRDLRTESAIRVTSPARTLLDCAPLLSQKTLARAVNEALRRKLLRRSDLADVAQRFPAYRGAPRLLEFVDAKGRADALWLGG